MKIDVVLLILVTMLAMAIAATFRKGKWPLVGSGFKQAGHTFRSIGFRVLLGMTLGGFIQVLIPSSLIAAWLGPASGIKGILIGSYVGLFFSGGPYVILPIVAAIYKAGAGSGAVIALLTGGMLQVQGLISFHIPFLGVRLPVSRFIACLLVPPLVGLAGGALYQL
ncbi:MAG: permease, partial [bacterium]|nr:permease [bacterium]